jgi:hypothetical protein
MAAHRYWRINVSAVNASTLVGLVKVSLYETSFTDVATGGTASASSTGEGSAANLLDTSNTSNWVSSGALPQWWKVDLGSGNDKDITFVKLVGRRDGAWASDQCPKDFSLQYSDDNSSWTTLFSVTGSTGWTDNGEARYFNSSGLYDPPPPPGTASKQFWRVKSTAVDGGAFLGMLEVAFKLADDSVQRTGGTAYVKHEQEGTAANLFDGVATGTTSYYADGAPTAWAGYRYAGAKDIVKVSITARETYQNQAPKDFTVEYWDGSAYQVAYTGTGETGWTSGQTRTFTWAAASTARPVVFVCT